MKTILQHNALLIAAFAVAILLIGTAIAITAEPQDAGTLHETVAPRASLEDYTWEELASLASEIAACGSEEDAIARAHAYSLCGEDGSLDATHAKEIELADGTLVEVALAGIWHDDRTGGGKAGLTFAFLNAAGEHSMNHSFEDARGRDADSTGGWQASDMRAWLGETFFYQLPADLRARIVPVQKRTANAIDLRAELDEAGHVAGSAADWVGETSDRLWLFSAAELCGSVPKREDLDVDSTMSAIYAAEGDQYRLFADREAAAFKPSDALVRRQAGPASVSTAADAESGAEADPAATAQPTTWWLRTKTLEFGDGFWLVGTDGTPLNGLGEDARGKRPLLRTPTALGPRSRPRRRRGLLPVVAR